jgi:SAM-dependent methyltransferase
MFSSVSAQSGDLLLHTAGKSDRRPMSLNSLHVRRAADLTIIFNAKVLVVGASSGKDCLHFIELGAGEVHGIDPIESVGSEGRHKQAHYHCGTIERTGLPSDYFDLVFAHATMEHVPDIEAGFAEMARLTRPGGIVYSHASPLWQSPYGHHMQCFVGHPWVHLLLDDPDAIIAFARENGITGERGHDAPGIVRYMMDRRFFNQLPADTYVKCCASLSGIQCLANELVLEHVDMLRHPNGVELLLRGFRPSNLLATTHHLTARKDGWSRRRFARALFNRLRNCHSSLAGRPYN